jgi:UDP-N-acetylglucosamine--N-acetylmuramyl-(pentapeptide) pyrophosphoryl-undecaprenol N-acetylglucosamine transferase
MKVVLTGGGTGGHFYPLIAIAEELQRIADEEKLASFKMYYFSDKPYDKKVLLEHAIEFRSIPAGKIRLYFSLSNIFDMVKTFIGIFVALWKLFWVYPDVVMGKGGYASFPTLVAAKILRIPIVIHETDSVPGRVNKIVGKWADKIAVSYFESSEYFPKERVAHTGQPIRSDMLDGQEEGAYEYFSLTPGVPTILVLGGSQGAKKINEALIGVAGELSEKYQVIHQTGDSHVKTTQDVVYSMLEGYQNKERYHVYGFLSKLGMAMAGGAATIVVTRAGGSLFEVAAWGVVGDKELLKKMQESCKNFYHPDASTKIAKALIQYGYKHAEKEEK